MQVVPRSWQHPDAKFISDFIFKNGHTVPLFKVESIHALNQLVGYTKFLNQTTGKIFFRGQTELYDSLLPSLYRVSSSASSIITRNTKILKYIRDCSNANRMFNDVNVYSKEPLLQHYGIKTRWLDLVDNLWVALWFSMHEYKTQAFDRVYEFVTPRRGVTEKSYLVLVFTDAVTEKSGCPGFYRGKESSIVDLRISVPSIFLRPHCQHALLIKPQKMTTIYDADLAKYVNLIIEIDTIKVKEWIGGGRLLTAENIYPSPLYDHGYSILLENAPHKKEDIKHFGSITSVSYAAPNCA